uniref:Uncharacterized protein n=1 Tax=Amphimedon queenslandica TaxID=400682 RepID=A0A1X7VIN2_AMPQE
MATETANPGNTPTSSGKHLREKFRALPCQGLQISHIINVRIHGRSTSGPEVCNVRHPSLGNQTLLSPLK